MDGQKNNKQKLSRHLSDEQKKPKVRLDLDKEDFSEDLQNLFNNIPIVRQERTFQK